MSSGFYYHHLQTMLPSWLKESNELRAQFSGQAIIHNIWMGGSHEQDEDILRQHGFDGYDDYWKIVLAEPVTMDSFAHDLSVHVTNFKEVGPDQNIKRALKIALAAGNISIVEHPHKKDVIDPRKAADWLNSNPKQQHLLPKSLRKHLSLSTRQEVAPAAIGRPKGTGYQRADQELVEEIRAAVDEGRASSYTAAAKTVVGDGKGVRGNSVDSMIKRLAKAAKQRQSKGG